MISAAKWKARAMHSMRGYMEPASNISYMKQSDMLKCPFAIMMPEHYREDGTCKCNDPEHRKMMIAEWEYTEQDFKNKGLI